MLGVMVALHPILEHSRLPEVLETTQTTTPLVGCSLHPIHKRYCKSDI